MNPSRVYLWQLFGRHNASGEWETRYLWESMATDALAPNLPARAFDPRIDPNIYPFEEEIMRPAPAPPPRNPFIQNTSSDDEEEPAEEDQIITPAPAYPSPTQNQMNVTIDASLLHRMCQGIQGPAEGPAVEGSKAPWESAPKECPFPADKQFMDENGLVWDTTSWSATYLHAKQQHKAEYLKLRAKEAMKEAEKERKKARKAFKEATRTPPAESRNWLQALKPSWGSFSQLPDSSRTMDHARRE